MHSRKELARRADEGGRTLHEAMNPTPAMQRKSVEEFNAIVPIGGAVDVRLDDGTVFSTTTRNAADMLGGHTAVVWVKGICGAYLLSRVTRK